ncbi:Vps13 [Symbiodinium sp. CCMP2592]|nr:Vps13 [Symbiodinium sp. CCMP2592]
MDLQLRRSGQKAADELLDEIRQNRKESVEMQAAQQLESRRHQKLVDEAKKQGSEVADKAGMAAKLARQFMSNMIVDISDIKISIAEPDETQAVVAAELKAIFAQAASDEDIHRAKTTDALKAMRTKSSIIQADADISKEIGFKGFLVTCGFGDDVDTLVSLQLLQILFNQQDQHTIVSLKFGEEGSADFMRASSDQLRALVTINSCLNRESTRLQALLSQHADEVNLESAYEVQKLKDEYVHYCLRDYREELEILGRRDLKLDARGDRRLQTLRDNVPLQMQAKWFMEVAEQLASARSMAAGHAPSWQKRALLYCACWQEDDSQMDVTAELEKRKQEVQALQDVEVPKKMNVSVQIAHLRSEIIGSQQESILLAELNTVAMFARYEQKVDWKNMPAANVELHLKLQRIRVTHEDLDMLTFGDGNDEPAFLFDVQNRIEATRTVVSLTSKMQPLQFTFRDSFLKSLKMLQYEIKQTQQDLAVDLKVETKPTKFADHSPTGSELALQRVAIRNKSKSGILKDTASAAAPSDPYGSSYEQAKAWMESEAGQEMLSKARERTPNALEVDVELCAPRLHFKVREKASVEVSFGTLKLKTTSEDHDIDELDKVEIEMTLQNTQLSVRNRSGSEHVLLSPVMLSTTLFYSPKVAQVCVLLGPVKINASPVMLQILATVPKVLQDALADPVDPDALQATQADEEATQVKPTLQEAQLVKASAKNAVAVSQQSIKKLKEKTEAKATPKQTWQFVLDMEHVEVELRSDADPNAPVLRLNGCLQAVEVRMEDDKVTVPLETSVMADGDDPAGLGQNCQKRKQMLRLSVDGYNMEVGRFEPALESFELACQVTKEELTGLHVHLIGRKPLLVNVNPVFLRRLTWYGKRLADSLVPMPENPGPTPVRYALLNLTHVKMRLRMRLASGEVAFMDVAPTGDAWRSLDHLDVAFPPLIHISVAAPGPALRNAATASHATVDLGLLNSARIPNTPYMVQLLRPSVEGALILISTPVRIFNDTTVNLGLRFGSQHALWTSCAERKLLFDQLLQDRDQQMKEIAHPGAVPSWLMPRGFVSAPLEPPTKPESESEDSDEDELREEDMNWEMRLSSGSSVWKRAKLTHACKFSSIQLGSESEKFSVLAVCDYEVSAPPAAVNMLNVRLLPPLQLVSCMPCDVEVSYALQSPWEKTDEKHESITRLLEQTGTMPIYDVDFPGTVYIRARLVPHGEWSTWAELLLEDEDIGEEDRLLSRLEGEMTVESEHHADFTMSILDKGNGKVMLCCQTWLIDRCHLDMSVTAEKKPLVDAGEGLHLCGSLGTKYCLERDGKFGPNFTLPAGLADWTVTSAPTGRMMCIRSTALEGQEDNLVRVLELLPRYVVVNELPFEVEFRAGTFDVIVDACKTIMPRFTVESLQFRVRERTSTWSSEIPVTENSAGCYSILLGEECYIVEIRSDHGVMYFIVREGSMFRLSNSIPRQVCEIHVRNMIFRAHPGEACFFAWLDPFDKDKELEVELVIGDDDFKVDPRTAYRKKLRGGLELYSTFDKDHTNLEVRMRSETESTAKTVLDVILPRIGVSLVGRVQSRVTCAELVYMEMAMLSISAVMNPKEDTQTLNISLGDVQVDYQMPEDKDQHAVILGNAGVSGHHLVRPVLQLHVERGQSSSSDIHLCKLVARLDHLEVSISDSLITAMGDFMERLQPSITNMTAAGFERKHVAAVREKAAMMFEGKDPAKIPRDTIIQIDQLFIAEVQMKMWVSVRLKRLRNYLPSWVRAVIGSLSLSKSFSMEGANVSLSSKFLEGLRGKPVDLASSFAHEWMGNMIRAVCSALGHSSLMAIPKAPIALIGSAGNLASSKLGGAMNNTGAFFDSMTFDDDYASRHNRHRQAEIEGASQGMASAVNSLGEGLSGLLDIFRKPLEGARNHGVGGFVTGIGKGLTSSVIKGVNGVADAAADLGRGVMAEASKKIKPQHGTTLRVRHPRALYGPIGAIMDFSELDSHVMAYLQKSGEISEPVEAIVPLFRWQPQELQEEDSSEEEERPAPVESVEVMVLARKSFWIAEVPLTRITPVRSFYPDAGRSYGRPDEVKSLLVSRLVPLARVQPDPNAGRFQIHKQFPIAALKSVKWAQRQNGARPDLLLECMSQVYSIKMPWSLGGDLPKTILKALADAIHVGKIQVEEISDVQTEVRHGFMGDELSNPVQVTEEAWEVERAAVAAGTNSSWQKPFLPTEPEHQQCWMDAGLQVRHPLLDPQRFGRSTTKPGPPMKSLRLWRPKGTWQLEVNLDETDGEGWVYAPIWGSTDWQLEPRVFIDVVRKRKWTLTYKLNFLATETFLPPVCKGMLDRRGVKHCGRARNLSVFMTSICSSDLHSSPLTELTLLA